MKEHIYIDLRDEFGEENRKFFNLLDGLKWDLLIDEYSSPDNDKSINELLTELLES